METPAASIIIPVRGLPGPTRLCLESVRRHTALAHEVVVVDNGSRDPVKGDLARRARAGELRLIRNPGNASFSASINQGMRLARGGLLVWLNNDAVVGPEWLERLRDCLARRPGAGAAGPCTNDPLSGSGRGARHAPVPERLSPFAAAWSLGFDRQDEEVGLLSGFCLALRREAYEAAGPLDERFVWGEEDLDYCLRLRRAGFQLFLARDVFVYHAGGATRGRWSAAQREDFRRRNLALLRRKWAGSRTELGRDARAAARFLAAAP